METLVAAASQDAPEQAREPGASAQPDLVVRGVSKYFDTPAGSAQAPRPAVKDLHLTVERGQFFSLLGPSGCGKTTTLRMIAGFETPSAGDILLRGERVNDLPPNLRNVNTTFQSYALFPHLNVYDNIAFGLRRKGASAALIAEKVAWALQLVRLEGFDKRRPATMSGGEQQRVAMARALVNTPALLLLDEPLSALDEKLRRQMQFELKRIQREIGISFVMVTHDQQEALTLSDVIAVMNQGELEQVGSPQELYEHPKTRFVAEFMGAANFLRGRIERAEGHALVISLEADQQVVVPRPPHDGTWTPGSEVDLVIRPERFELRSTPPLPEEHLHALPLKVHDRVYQGAQTRYSTCTKAGTPLVITTSQHDVAPSANEDFLYAIFSKNHIRLLGKHA